MEKAQKVADEIKSETKGEVTAIKLNLASMESIRSAAEELKSRHSKIHFLINNAGRLDCYVLNQDIFRTFQFYWRTNRRDDVPSVENGWRIRNAARSESPWPFFVDSSFAGYHQAIGTGSYNQPLLSGSHK